jgi:thiamine biosynthesis lipoprotein
MPPGPVEMVGMADRTEPGAEARAVAQPLRGKCFRVEHVMGLPVSIDIRDGSALAAPEEIDRLLDACFEALRQCDDIFSLWRPDTPMARLSDGRAGLSAMPVEVLQVLRLCARYDRETGGRFRARRPEGPVDPTGLVKGWAVARVGRLLLGAGLRHWCINAAGDVLVHGQARPGEGWSVGISDPISTGRLLDTVTLTAGAVATSGTSERGQHIWDPLQRNADRGVLAATVVARDVVEADVLATAAVTEGRDAARWLSGRSRVEGLIVRTSGEVECTPGWPGTLAAAVQPRTAGR